MVSSPETAQLALAEVLDIRPPEGERGELLRVEEVGRLQMPVALRVAGVDAARVDADSTPRRRQSDGSNRSSPLQRVNGRTLVNIMCRTPKWTAEWPGSMLQVAIVELL